MLIGVKSEIGGGGGGLSKERGVGGGFAVVRMTA